MTHMGWSWSTEEMPQVAMVQAPVMAALRQLLRRRATTMAAAMAPELAAHTTEAMVVASPVFASLPRSLDDPADPVDALPACPPVCCSAGLLAPGVVPAGGVAPPSGPGLGSG